MGLDILAVEKIELVRALDDEDQSDDDSLVHVYPNEYFPAHADRLVPGSYRVHGERLEFRAGSYSSYGTWREMLCKLAYGGTQAETVWTDQVTSGLFYEVINFSDAEGVIGPKTSAKLASDFAEFAARFDAFVETLADEADRDGYRALYAKWRRAFELAARDGAVIFC